MIDTIGTDGGIDQWVMSQFRNTDHKVWYLIDTLYDGCIGEYNTLTTFVTPT